MLGAQAQRRLCAWPEVHALAGAQTMRQRRLAIGQEEAEFAFRRLVVDHLGAEQLLDETVAARGAFLVARAERPGAEHAPAGGDARADGLALGIRQDDGRGDDQHRLALDRSEVAGFRVANRDVVAAEEAAPRHEEVVLVARLGALEVGARRLAMEKDDRHLGRGERAAAARNEQDCEEPYHAISPDRVARSAARVARRPAVPARVCPAAAAGA